MKLYDDLLAFKNTQREKYGNDFSAFMATFLDDTIINEKDKQYHQWDESVSSSPLNSDFSFSFGGRAYFVLGMHQGSPRLSRKFKYPTLVFNARYYFDLLERRGSKRRGSKLLS